MRSWVTLIIGATVFVAIGWAMFFRSGPNSDFYFGDISAAHKDAARISVTGLSSSDRFAARTASVMVVDMPAVQGHECAYLDDIANNASDSRLSPEPQNQLSGFDHAAFNTYVLKFATIENEHVDVLVPPVDGIDLKDSDYSAMYAECLSFIDRAAGIYSRVLEADL